MVLYLKNKRNKRGDGMQLNIHGKGVDVGASLREHIEYRLPQIVDRRCDLNGVLSDIYALVTYNKDEDVYRSVRQGSWRTFTCRPTMTHFCTRF